MSVNFCYFVFVVVVDDCVCVCVSFPSFGFAAVRLLTVFSCLVNFLEIEFFFFFFFLYFLYFVDRYCLNLTLSWYILFSPSMVIKRFAGYLLTFWASICGFLDSIGHLPRLFVFWSLY
jgi:hypothetical protein